MTVNKTRAGYVIVNIKQSVLIDCRCATVCRVCCAQQNEFNIPVIISEVRLSSSSEQNVKQNLYHP